MKVDFVSGFDPLPISSYDEDTFGYQIIKKTVHDIFTEATVSPGKAFSIVLLNTACLLSLVSAQGV